MLKLFLRKKNMKFKPLNSICNNCYLKKKRYDNLYASININLGAIFVPTGKI